MDERPDAIPDGWHVEWGDCMHYDPKENHRYPKLVEDVPSCRHGRTLRKTER